jgi:DNA-binding MarR family transcriptional regulator
MGRGLSQLQRQILLLALRKKFVLCQDLLFLWGVHPGAISDKGKYAAAHSSLSRALTRLWWRGLVEYWQNKITRYRTAVTLTEKGKVLAQVISEEEAEGAVNG